MNLTKNYIFIDKASRGYTKVHSMMMSYNTIRFTI